VKETYQADDVGAMLYDASAVDQISPGLFEPAYWRSGATTPETATGGRGTVVFVNGQPARWALRHYQRGGLPGRILNDQFLYLGENATRCFREFRLLFALCEMGLPVPRPIAARYQRSGLVYRADLITFRIPGAMPLSQVLALGQAPTGIWGAVGSLVRRFHDASVFHADLNAHNILVGDAGQLYLLDFDRGRIRRPGRWRAANLQRLQRSLMKISRASSDLKLGENYWDALMKGYLT
jgi:3-deoxy-D-manno-octulosonic acid kinase